jgi:inorganic pyrophosphatase
MDRKVRVYVEIEKGSNQKFEYSKMNRRLELDRVLKAPFIYPYSYGFITDTLGKDGDELDALIVTDKVLPNDKYYDVFIVGVLVMEDEQGMDEKLLCVLDGDYNTVKDISDVSDDIKEKVRFFFTNYKNNTDGRWSKVFGFQNKEFAIKLFEECLVC